MKRTVPDNARRRGRLARARGERSRPHQLAVYWRALDGIAGERASELLVPAGIVRLNASATAIWERIDGRRDEAGLARDLARLYPAVAPDRLRAAVDELLGQLERLGAVVRRWRPLDPCDTSRVGVAAR